MEEWIDPRYAELVATVRRQQAGEEDAPPFVPGPVGQDSAAPCKWFIMGRAD
ncbi:hypothetical protein LN042_04875 [Kitasatospora sp. RB6PN24]|uniref:hypothetical protein n=1 Tax=Kitasatospora humi TaxID=2893891 RepID=UPI001E41FA21|nr:hypothetical protein [Kitasatospora humi]MCC9306448.1 hypothetical protein [Kitasatospora humi]